MSNSLLPTHTSHYQRYPMIVEGLLFGGKILCSWALSPHGWRWLSPAPRFRMWTDAAGHSRCIAAVCAVQLLCAAFLGPGHRCVCLTRIGTSCRTAATPRSTSKIIGRNVLQVIFEVTSALFLMFVDTNGVIGAIMNEAAGAFLRCHSLAFLCLFFCRFLLCQEIHK